MALFVADASVTLAWCFEDEAGVWTDQLLERLARGDQIVVPAHWPNEILNGLLVASRRKRIGQNHAALLWDEVSRLPIEIEPPLTSLQGKAVWDLGEKHGLTVYDAAYLELAQRRLALGSLDADLRKAAQAEGVALI